MDPLGDRLTTRRIQSGCKFIIEPYPSRQFGFLDNPDHQFGNGLGSTRTRTRSDGPDPLLTQVTEKLMMYGDTDCWPNIPRKSYYHILQGYSNANKNVQTYVTWPWQNWRAAELDEE